MRHEAADEEAEFQRAFTVELALGVAAALYRARRAGARGLYDDDDLLALTLAVAYLPIGFALQAPQWIFFRRMDYVRLRVLQAIVPLGTVFVATPLLLAGVGVWALVIGPLAGNALAVAAALRASPYPLRLRPDRAAARRYLRFSWPIFLTALGTLVVAQGQIALFGLDRGLAAAGWMTLAVTLTRYADRADQIVATTIYPAIVRVRDRLDLPGGAVRGREPDRAAVRAALRRGARAVRGRPRPLRARRGVGAGGAAARRARADHRGRPGRLHVVRVPAGARGVRPAGGGDRRARRDVPGPRGAGGAVAGAGVPRRAPGGHGVRARGPAGLRAPAAARRAAGGAGAAGRRAGGGRLGGGARRPRRLWGGDRPLARRSPSSRCGPVCSRYSSGGSTARCCASCGGLLREPRRGARMTARLCHARSLLFLAALLAPFPLRRHAAADPRPVRRGTAAPGRVARRRRGVAVRRLRLGLRPGPAAANALAFVLALTRPSGVAGAPRRGRRELAVLVLAARARAGRGRALGAGGRRRRGADDGAADDREPVPGGARAGARRPRLRGPRAADARWPARGARGVPGAPTWEPRRRAGGRRAARPRRRPAAAALVPRALAVAAGGARRCSTPRSRSRRGRATCGGAGAGPARDGPTGRWRSRWSTTGRSAATCSSDRKDLLGYELPLIGIAGLAPRARLAVADPAAHPVAAGLPCSGSPAWPTSSRADDLHQQPLLVVVCALAAGLAPRAPRSPGIALAAVLALIGLAGAANLAGASSCPPAGERCTCTACRASASRPARQGAPPARPRRPGSRAAGGADLRRAAALGSRHAHRPAHPLPRPPPAVCATTRRCSTARGSSARSSPPSRGSAAGRRALDRSRSAQPEPNRRGRPSGAAALDELPCSALPARRAPGSTTSVRRD